MGYIYKIINDINNKVYIGQTTNSIEERFKEHLLDAKKTKCEKRPLYDAINKYGPEHFYIEEIEKCPDNQLQEREIYWIAYYRGYEDGYNATHGGDGKTLYDHEAIYQELLHNINIQEIANKFHCCVDVIYDVAHTYKIDLSSNCGKNFLALKKIVYQYSKDGQFIQCFNSAADAARWLFENKKCAALTSGVRGHITEVCNNNPKRKTAYGYIWKYS